MIAAVVGCDEVILDAVGRGTPRLCDVVRVVDDARLLPCVPLVSPDAVWIFGFASDCCAAAEIPGTGEALFAMA
jgi:hypothetical protein